MHILDFLISEGCELIFSFFPSHIRLLVVFLDFCFPLYVEKLPISILMLFVRYSVFRLPSLVVGVLRAFWGNV
jgi:hypothetical protein